MNIKQSWIISLFTMILTTTAFAEDRIGHFDGDFTHAGGVCFTTRLVEYPDEIYAIDVNDLRRHPLIDTINMKSMMNYKVRIRIPQDVIRPRGDTLQMLVPCASGDGRTEKFFYTIEDVWSAK